MNKVYVWVFLALFFAGNLTAGKAMACGECAVCLATAEAEIAEILNNL